MNLIDRIKIYTELNRNSIQVIAIFSAIVLFSLILNFSQKEINDFNHELYSEKSKPIKIDYELIHGPPALDSSEPILNGILISYSFQYNDQLIKDEYFLTKLGLQQVRRLIDEDPNKLFVRYEYGNPNNSIITLE